ncbi:Listeria-Bacteroides repeat domain [Bacteroidales bacterium Barb6]|nr:Listeria-Bacteroides repeat domain [Bacteroidales bacterium Barb6]
MKRKIVLASLFLACVFQTMGLESWQVVVDDVHYDINTRTKVAGVSQRNQKEEEFYRKSTLVIPAAIYIDKQMYDVTQINLYAFRNDFPIEYLTISSNVQSILAFAFQGCFNLKEIHLARNHANMKIGAAFGGVHSEECIVVVPAEAEKDFDVRWEGFKVYLESYRLSARPADSQMGEVIDGEREAVAFKSELVVEAKPAYGYHFAYWTSDEIKDSLTLTVNPYREEKMMRHVNLQAHFTENDYNVNLSAGKNGTITQGNGAHPYNTLTTIEAEADSGYHFVKWTDRAGNTVSTANPYAFTVKKDEDIQAYFEANSYTVSLFTSGNNGTIKPGGGGAYLYKTQATAEAQANPHYHFAKWTDRTGNTVSTANPYTFTVEKNTELQANFEDNHYIVSLSADKQMGTAQADKKEGYVYNTRATVTALPNGEFHFVKWTNQEGDFLSANSSYTFTVTENTLVQAHFETNSLQVRLYADNGRITPPGSGTYQYNTEARVMAEADYGYHFVKWTNAKGESLSTNNPYTFVVKEYTEVRANFVGNSCLVNVLAVNGGKAVLGGGTYPYNNEVGLTADAGYGYHFEKWTNANNESLSTDNPYTFVVKGDVLVKAYFAENYYLVNASAGNNHGRIKSGNGSYSYNANVAVEAEAYEGYRFVRWTSAKGQILSAANPYTFEVKEDMDMKAHFVANTDFTDDISYRVTLSAGDNGGITSGDGTYLPDAEATIEAEAYAEYYFVKWTDANGDSLSADNPYTFVVKGDTDIKAHFADFAAGGYRVSVTAGDNGTIKSGNSSYLYGAEAMIEAVADTGYHFVKWTMANGNVFAANPFRFTVKGNTSVKADFAANSYQVILSAKNGRIRIGWDVYDRYVYDYNTEAVANAEAEDGYHFVKWVNAAGSSLSGDNPYRFVVKGDMKLTAIFEKGVAGNETVAGSGARAYYADGMLHLVNLEGFAVAVSTIDGRQVLQFRASNAVHPAILPAGIYILNAANGKERYTAKFAVKN